ncbi:DoxX family protein [Nocardia asteroides]|uniref:DoxX family protein n=1 Tax=Nocardia asteroides TaxID=1824 RepID=UPI001E4A6D97|nr:DoxX family protein [Nocardia asteroides]UGT56795.1 DoxX family protein [Nocardia asteroides]
MTTATTERVTGDDVSPAAPPPAWHPITRIAFRFTVAYLGLFCLWMAQITFVFLGVLARQLPEDAIAWQMMSLAPVSRWIGEHVFGVEAELTMNGSGDQAAIWIQCGLVLLVALLVTVVWSVLDRRRSAYPRLLSWFMTALRLCVGGQMLFYGFAKLIPTQMPEPALTTLLTRVGDLSPMSMLWTQVGSSPVYEMSLGLAEVLAGLLLFWPRTATLGALLGVVSMAQVFLLNLTFDVPVKMLSGHLLLMSLVLLAPQARRLANVLVLERDSGPATQPPLFGSARANRWASLAQVALGLWIVAGCVYLGMDSWREYGGGAPKPELYGIWEVAEYTVDGDQVPALRTDETRWQRLIIDTGGAAYQRMDDTLVPATATADPAAPTLTLTLPAAQPDSAPTPYATLTVERPAEDRLVLRGDVGGRATTVTLTRTDLDSFPLRGTEFRWVQNNPYVG